MKPFNLDKAKAGKPVCTRGGRKARIICFDAKSGTKNDVCLVTLVTEEGGIERVCTHNNEGKYFHSWKSDSDLMMAEAIETLPNSWEEFCDSYPIENNEYYLDDDSTICERFVGYRSAQFDKNIFRTEEQAEAMLAFIQLIRLRDVYRQGWEPDWTQHKIKYCIGFYRNGINDTSSDYLSYPLSFQSAKIRDKFLENFRDLIEQAKEFI